MQIITSKAAVTIGTTKPPFTNGKIQVTDDHLKFTTGRRNREVLAVGADAVRSVGTVRGSLKSMAGWMLAIGVAPLIAMLARSGQRGLSPRAAIAIAAGGLAVFAVVAFLSARRQRVRVAFRTSNGDLEEAFFILPKKTRDAARRKLETLVL